MANKRMFSLDVVDTDRFVEMPATSQNLYFHLGMRADGKGYVRNPKAIMRVIGCNQGDMDILQYNGYVLKANDGVVIK